jgi:hypothetical protein
MCRRGRYENFIYQVLSILSLRLFVKQIFNRVLFVSQELILMQQQVQDSKTEAGPAPDLWKELSEYGRTVSLLDACVTYIVDALSTMAVRASSRTPVARAR